MGRAPTLSKDLPATAAAPPPPTRRIVLPLTALPVAALAPAALCVLAGALLRLVQPDLLTFKFDEATASAQTLQMLRSHTLVSSGTLSSVGGLFPPLFDFLLAPP